MKSLLLGLLLMLPLIGSAQDDYYQKPSGKTPARFVITLRDGTRLQGQLVRQDSTEALIRTDNLGEVRVPAGQIVRIEQIGATETGAGYPNLFPQTMRLAPTAFTAERNRLFYRNYYLYFSQFEYGLTDNWSVGAAFYSFIPTAAFSLSTKVSVPVNERLRIGVSAQYAAVSTYGLFAGSSLAGLGYVQGLVTTGDRQNNSTFGLGWSISNRGLSRNVVATFGIVRKVGPKLTFISENFALFGSGINRDLNFAGILSGGIRFDRPRHAFDLAAYVPLIIGSGVRSTVTLIPFGSYHLRIGK